MIRATTTALCFLAITASTVTGFSILKSSSPNGARLTSPSTTASTTALQAEDDNTFMNWARASRSAQSDDRVVELKRPLGIVLNSDAAGNVFIEEIAPKGNAARDGNVKVGDVVTMCSATFGNDMWSTRGVGLTRVLAAIRVRAGGTIKLALESSSDSKRKRAMTTTQIEAQEEARLAAQAKKDSLLSELEQDEVKLTGGKKFFGLF